MVASAYAYFNFKFSEYRFIDFDKYVFYGKEEIFTPKEDNYLLLMYSSHDKTHIQKIKDLKVEYKIIAIDIHQKRFKSDENISYVSTGINSAVNIIQKFNIYNLPSLLFIKKDKNIRYKQDSTVESF